MLLLVQNETFLSFLPLPLTLKEGRIKKQVLRISKNNKSRGGIFLYNKPTFPNPGVHLNLR